MKRYSTVLWVVILYCVSNALLFAEIPRSLSVQGILSNSAYDIDKVHIIKTTLYSAKSDDNVLFTQFPAKILSSLKTHEVYTIYFHLHIFLILAWF